MKFEFKIIFAHTYIYRIHRSKDINHIVILLFFMYLYMYNIFENRFYTNMMKLLLYLFDWLIKYLNKQKKSPVFDKLSI